MKKRHIIIITLGILLFLTYAIFSNHGIIKRIKLDKELKILKNEIIDLKHDEDSLREAYLTIQFDKDELERLAREKYGMIKPGEHVFFLKERKSK